MMPNGIVIHSLLVLGQVSMLACAGTMQESEPKCACVIEQLSYVGSHRWLMICDNVCKLRGQLHCVRK